MLLKNSLKKIKKSFGRYLSLVLIIFIGVGFYTGIIESIPNIKRVQTNFYNEKNTMDIKVLSTLGLNDEDIKAIKKVDDISTVVGSYSLDTLVNDEVVRVHAIEKDINKPLIIKGRRPLKNDECLADDNFYNVGDIIKIREDFGDDLKEIEYKVVGTIYSPMYTGNEYGSSDIGNGKLHSFIYINKDNFNFDYYTEAFISIKTKNDVPYNKKYEKDVEDVIEDIKIVGKERINDRVDEIVASSYGMITKESLKDNSWHILDRDEAIASYLILGSQYEQVTTIANIIPIFFIIIVALMTSNTMKRMITEERGEMGTLLSLGYSNRSVINTYLMYVLSATLSGAILGYFIGTILLPQIVYNCFPIFFPPITYHFDLGLLLASTLASAILMILVTVFACLKELKQSPAYLLRPEAPKNGKVILLERINFIWNKLSFSMKITMRNISRYKNRVLITLIGTAGCCFLIMLGFALRDSIRYVGTKQYNDIIKYDNMMILNHNVKELDEDLKNEFNNLIKDELLLSQTTYKAINSKDNLDVYVVVPKEEDLFYKYFSLNDKKTKEKLTFKDGIIVTPKIAERFDVKVGDKLTIEDSDKNKYKIKIGGIVENYVSNYIYMTPKDYKNIFKDEVTYNVVVSKNIKENDEIAKTLLDTKKILTINFSDDLLKTANEMVEGLDEVVILLVVISCMLAITVLYNLTSINISERTREIATLKVLGFRDNESNEYIYRETMITAVIGIILGLLITPPLHNIVMRFLEVDTLVFLKTIKIESYIYAAGLTLLFVLIMRVVTYIKLKKIDLIEPLKSVE